jgi:hypothetical protein
MERNLADGLRLHERKKTSLWVGPAWSSWGALLVYFLSLCILGAESWLEQREPTISFFQALWFATLVIPWNVVLLVVL